ncbi:hypothetical protein Desdi_2086 [Desulfitobacterium dichloroeliminans LMG P-21439]|uniref:Uncharacterized protein n=1 Tax=Desulfitobacterium dichloroeliminans (strain LMG P-21439 / DCA1) TaxID=871963 RepID=L0F6U5_DESDL|nr:hypothetical protein [Desulfitobacterium dichloroeliminans]AGA69529.1 hypothetical protein Desdi_2086 [Desulfitobacterium dichloroeliminans LMG P-21439]
MNAYRPAPYSNWITVLKIILLIIALYFSAIILSQVFTWFFSIAFVVIRIAVYFVTSILVLHFFLKLLFGYDLLRFILGSRFSR